MGECCVEESAHFDDVTEQRSQLVDTVRAVGRQPASAARLLEPPSAQDALGARDEVAEVGEGDIGEVADEALVEDALHLDYGRFDTELVVHEMVDTAGSGGLEHLFRLAGVHRERLLAQHMLTGGDGRHHGGMVEVGRRRDDDEIDVVELCQF